MEGEKKSRDIKENGGMSSRIMKTSAEVRELSSALGLHYNPTHMDHYDIVDNKTYEIVGFGNVRGEGEETIDEIELDDELWKRFDAREK